MVTIMSFSLVLCNVVNVFSYDGWDVNTLIVNEEPIYTEFPDYYSNSKHNPTDGLSDTYNIRNSIINYSNINRKPEVKREFSVVDFTKNKETYKISANLDYEGDNCIIYVGDESMNDIDKLRLSYEKIDKDMIPFVNNNFNKPTDIDHNGKVIILLYDIKDNHNNGRGGFIAGYFNSADLYKVNESNAGEILYVDTNPTKIWDATNTGVSTVVHEYQHLVQHNSKIPKDTWMNEGMSMLAEQLYKGEALNDRITSGLQYYGAYKGTPLMSWNEGSSVYANYSLSYTFFAYLYSQLGTDFIKPYYNSTEHDFRALVNIINDKLNMDIGEFMTNYYLTLVLNKPKGLYSFNYPGFEELYKNPGNGGVSYGNINPSSSGYGRINISDNIEKRNSVRVIKIKNNNIYKPTVKATEIIGIDRFETNTKVNSYNGENDTLILVDYKNPIYGLLSSPLASKYDADILLYKNKTSVDDIINKNNYKNIFVIGDVSVDINHDYKRITGKSLTELSLNITSEINSTKEKIILVNGDNKGSADALSVSAPASELKIPIISISNNMDRKIIDIINKYNEIIVVGGESTITENMLNGIDSTKITRLNGYDRYETNAKVLNHFYKHGADNIIVSKGWELIDSSISGTLSRNKRAPIVLISKNGINETQKRFLNYLSYTNVFVVGGGLDKNIINDDIINH